MNKTELKKRAEDYFKLYPNKKTLFATADGNFFLDKGPAQNHARSAKVECFEFNVDEKDEKPVKESDVKDELVKALVELDPKTANYHLMVRILKGLNAIPEDSKRPSIEVAITNMQAELKKTATADGDKKGETSTEGEQKSEGEQNNETSNT